MGLSLRVSPGAADGPSLLLFWDTPETQPGGNILLPQGTGVLSCNLPQCKTGQENRGDCGESHKFHLPIYELLQGCP